MVLGLLYNKQVLIQPAVMQHYATCLCGSSKNHDDCCGQFLGGRLPETAEQLMRSRYTAFNLLDESYLLETWHSSTRPKSLGLSQQDKTQWTGLRVLNHSTEGDTANVEFIARFKINGKAHKLHENSRFIKEQGRWFYVDGDNIS